MMAAGDSARLREIGAGLQNPLARQRVLLNFFAFFAVSGPGFFRTWSGV
jgi:hypothetical protein